jgi:hypothetical protein
MTQHMRTRFGLLSGAALLVTGVGLVAASALSAEWSAAGDQRSAAQTPQKSAGPSMVVYKSPT